MADGDEGKRLSITFPGDVYEALRKLAEAHERSVNGEVIWALRQYVREQEGESPQARMASAAQRTARGQVRAAQKAQAAYDKTKASMAESAKEQ